jgi:hypothetical protein
MVILIYSSRKTIGQTKRQHFLTLTACFPVILALFSGSMRGGSVGTLVLGPERQEGARESLNGP